MNLRPLSEAPTTSPLEVRRDQYGRYLVVPVNANKPTGYTRATTVSKALDSGDGLMPWKSTMTGTGLLRRPGLRAEFEALLSAHPEKGPWYGSPESKEAVKKLVERCAEAGGSTDRAEIGTALHAIVEQINRGETPTITQDSTRTDVDAYIATIAAHGITFDPHSIELTVVLDAWKVAGTADIGIAHIPGVGPVIADLKTGTNLDYSWQSIATQLSIYAHGDAAYRQGLNPDGSEDQRYEAPNVSQDVAVVIHLPAGEGRCTLHKVNIAAGWEAFERSMWARSWRSRRDLAVPLTAAKVAPPVTPAVETPMVEPIRTTLLTLVQALPADRQTVLRDSWPKTLPPLKSAEHWTPELLAEASRMIAAVAGDERVSPGADTAALPRGEGQSAADTTADMAPPGDTGPQGGGEGPGPLAHSSDAGSDATSSVAQTTSPASPPPPGGMSLDAWNTLDAKHLHDARLKGHLPAELYVPVEVLTDLKTSARALSPVALAYLDARTRELGIPHVSYRHLWLPAHVETVTALIAEAEAAVAGQTPDWRARAKACGISLAALMRKAKELGDGLGIPCPSNVDRLPIGPLTVALVAYLDELEHQAAA